MSDPAESTKRWNKVMEALGTLYNRYYSEPVSQDALPGDKLLKDLEMLMMAYDDWLD